MQPDAGQVWDPVGYAAKARFVSDLGLPVLSLLAPQPGERVLDLGCGDGALTARIAEAGAEVLGIDASPEFVAAARRRGLDVRLMDGHALGFAGTFDAVFSNAALHWMTRPDAVIDGVWRALRPGGRFVGEFGGGDNVATLRRALRQALRRRGVDPDRHDPWYFPGLRDYAALLEAAGFEVVEAALVPRPTPLPAGIDGWLETFAGRFLAAVPPAERPALLAEIREAVRPDLQAADGTWRADYVRLRFAARRPPSAPAHLDPDAAPGTAPGTPTGA